MATQTVKYPTFGGAYPEKPVRKFKYMTATEAKKLLKRKSIPFGRSK